MGDQATNALVAVALGSVLAVLLLIPTAAVQYRLDGRLGPLDLAILVTSAIYALAMWTYTLLPMPVDGTFACKGSQLRVLGSLGLIHVPDRGGPLALLREPAFLQIVLNVLLFVPLGYFIRVIAHRGVVVATLAGFALSLLIELTQRTGVWHLYSCAYRLFDVDDLIVNTLGATIGSLLSLLVVRRRRGEVVLPTTISFGRRLVGFACDVVFIALTGATAALAYRGWAIYLRDVPPSDLDHSVQAALQWGVPFAVEAVLVLGFGRTVGEWVVSLHTVPRRRGLLLPGRLVKLAVGVGPIFVLAPLWNQVVGPAAIALLAAYAVLTIAFAWRTTDHRGLSNTLGHLDLRIGDDADEDPIEAPHRDSP
ncbi:MAG TPA: VanZ family protein [Nocardioides sp.]|uniref:VanZ family protein n=1 Tax=uncultured Nocardioides sp. TaxID=198441 RepID=UPI00260C8ADE|nr:VanZ family protein [uncultured Nocardioides sp.]HRI98675.1 VanZ family protein [Nocardioides sp.]HRK47958.1 VanZ family protein [Nocardioides sp.]